MSHVVATNYYESVSREPATLGQPVIAVKYTIDGSGPFEVRLPKTPGWESKIEQAVRVDAQQRAKVLKLAFDI